MTKTDIMSSRSANDFEADLTDAYLRRGLALEKTGSWNRRAFLAALTCSSLSFEQVLAAESAYPQRPITIIVPFAPGGLGDVFARRIGDRMTVLLGQPVIVDNRPGATGALGARLAARAKPDGATLLLGATSEMAINVSVMKQLGYDPIKDFRPIALIGNAPLILVVPASAPYSTLSGLIAAARTSSEGLSYASSGTASPGHIAGVALARATGARMVHVPYKGAGQAMTDVLGAQVQMFFSSASAAISQVQSGKLKALAVCGPKRLAVLPDVPTMNEAGQPTMAFSLWGGLFAPAGTPDAIVDQLARTVNAILAEPAIHQRMDNEGSAVLRDTPAQFDAFVRSEIARYARIVQENGIQAE